MKDILITSSALILALLLVRKLFRKSISARMQYALWGLVLLRLLIPVHFPVWNFSLLNMTAPVETAVSDRLQTYLQPEHEMKTPMPPAEHATPTEHHTPDTNIAHTGQNVSTETTSNTLPKTDVASILKLVRNIGMVIAAVFFFITNFAFWLKVKKYRTDCKEPLPIETGRKVYVLPEGILASPCLFVRSIYLTPKVFESETMLRHVLCHEEMHARHLDPLWSFLKAVCVALYWFDPLVWIAAYYAGIDCELACDESALIYLGEEERISYGETLLSLISVKPAANPFLSATTMTSGKKQLKNRILLITHKRRQTIAAVLTVLLLSGIVSACTFSKGLEAKQQDSSAGAQGAETTPVANDQSQLTASTDDGQSQITTPTDSDQTQSTASTDNSQTQMATSAGDGQAQTTASTDGNQAQMTTPANSGQPQSLKPGATEWTNGSASLSGEELQWFNESFFNTGQSYYPCLSNQFANPAILYDKPQEVDLYELFYGGVDSGVDSTQGTSASDVATDQEIREVLNEDPDNLMCPVTKLTVSTMNICLRKYLGLTIDETDQTGLENFTYSSKYDAYYHMHGDTNYCGNIYFYCGEKEATEAGTTIRLYQNNGAGWYCVTLKENTDPRHGYQESPYVFLSNKQCEKPAIPTLMPENPVATISLAGLKPYSAPAITIENRPSSDFDGNYENRLANWDFDGRFIGAYRDTDHLVRIAEKLEDESYNVFITTTDAPMDCVFFFDDLFGHSGFYADYYASENHDDAFAPCRDYFYFDENGEIALLCRIWTSVSRAAFQMDLDGNGTDELIGDREIFFERGGQIYQADITKLIPEAFPDESAWSAAGWDSYSKCYRIAATATGDNTGNDQEPRQSIFFDGESLRIYENF